MRYILLLITSLFMLSCDKQQTGEPILPDHSVRMDLTTDLPSFDLEYRDSQGNWKTLHVEYPGRELIYLSMPKGWTLRFKAEANQEGFIAIYIFREDILISKEVVLGSNGSTVLDYSVKVE